MTDDPLQAKVLAVVAGVAGPQRTPPAPGPETPLAEGGFWLDSTALLEVIVACETEFGVIFDPDVDVTQEALGTIGTLTATIRAKTAGSTGP